MSPLTNETSFGTDACWGEVTTLTIGNVLRFTGDMGAMGVNSILVLERCDALLDAL